MNTDLISRADSEALFRTARSKLNPSDYKTADEFNTRDLMLLNAEQMIHLLPSVTSKPCEDAISRQAAIDAIDKYDFDFPQYMERFVTELRDAMKADLKADIKDLPSVTPKQRTGHWIECEDEVKCFCSECKEISDYPTKFCPNCGAKMVEQKESEDKE